VNRSTAVSVIIPAYNAERFIQDTIESVFAQSVQPSEIIVVDDGSTDGTAALLRSYGDRLHVLSGRRGSAAASRNAGARAASGAWLAFLDADDLWLPNKLERQLAAADADEQIALVYTDRYNIGTRGDLPEIQSSIQPLYAGDIFIDLMMRGNHITLSSTLVRTHVFMELGGFSEALRNAEDWDLWIRLAERHRVAACMEPLVQYRLHSNMKSSNPRHMQLARRAVIDRAMALPRSQRLSPITIRRINGATALTNASDAARRDARVLAWQELARSLAAWPFDLDLYKETLRIIARRR
jgi:glycosyltransferase involved in cell wall biosynthesis